MAPGLLAVTAPLVIAVLVWWWRGRSKGKPGKSLPTFLLGYLGFFTYVGFSDFPIHRFRSATPSDYIFFVLGFTLSCYMFGGIGWLCLIGLKDRLPSALQWWLSTPYDSTDPKSAPVKCVATLDIEAAVQRSRHRAIEECAEEAYEYLIDNEVESGVDYDRAERTAGRLRDAILALGETV